MSDPFDAVSFHVGRESCNSIMSRCFRFSQNKNTPVENKSTFEQLASFHTDELSPPKIHRCPSSPIQIPASPNILMNCNRDAALICQGMRYISAYCGIGRTPSNAWWELPDIRASLKRHRQQLLRPCPCLHVASPSNNASSSSKSCIRRLGFAGTKSHALTFCCNPTPRAVP